MSSNAQDVALIALVVTAPGALVLLVALVRGYSVEVRLHRDRKGEP